MPVHPQISQLIDVPAMAVRKPERSEGTPRRRAFGAVGGHRGDPRRGIRAVGASLVHPDPITPQQMQFSLPYALACAALHGRVRFEDLAPGTGRDPAKRAVMERVTTERAADPSTGEVRAEYSEGTRFTLTLNDGRSATGFCGIAHGMPERPLSDTDLLDKLLAAGAFAGVALPPVEIGCFDPIAFLDQALGAPT